MSDLQKLPFSVAANGVQTLQCVGTHFVVLTATGPISVQPDTRGKMAGIGSGEGYKGQAFNSLTIFDVSGAPNSGTVLIADDDYFNNRLTGSLTITQNKVATVANFSSVAATVTNVISNLANPNSLRQYLAVQNNDPTGIIFLRFDGGVPTSANGLRVYPGQTWETGVIVPLNYCTALGSIASNPNVVVLEG
jgi:hypothetical protein